MPIQSRLRSESSLIFFALTGLTAIFFPWTASATPQASVGATAGVALTESRGDVRGGFHLGARADVLFFRTRERDMAFGPYVEIASERLKTLELGGGASWLVPVLPSFPLVLSTGFFEWHAPASDLDLALPAPSAWEPGVTARLFFGPRSYNFHSCYGLANGLFIQGRYGLADVHTAEMIVGLQIDLMVLVLPVLFAYEAITH